MVPITRPSVISVLLTLAIVVNVGLLGWAQMLSIWPPAVTTVYRAGITVDPSTPFETLDLAGTPIAGPGNAFAVRYVSNTCGYCEADTEGKRLATDLEQSGIPAYVIVPRSGTEVAADQLPSPTAPQATFVSMGWLKHFRLSATPTFMVFDRNGALIWHHEGIMTPSDVDAAKRRFATHGLAVNAGATTELLTRR